MYRISIESKDGSKKVIKPSAFFGKNKEGRVSNWEAEKLAQDIAWDTFGPNVKTVVCEKI